MRADFSRLRFERNKHYTSVLEQQGRVALDADHNEQRAIDENLRGTANNDIIGDFGGPKDDAGFAITVEANTITIGAGRYYVRGILCESEAQVDYGSQPYLIHPAAADSDLLSALSRGSIGSIRLFLEVWRRIVTVLDDPCLREPALGQADTTTRLQTVWRVVAETTAGSKPTAVPFLFPGNLGFTTLAQQSAVQRAGAIVATNLATAVERVSAVPISAIPVSRTPISRVPIGGVTTTPVGSVGATAPPATGVAPGATTGAAPVAGTGAAPTASTNTGCCDQMYQQVTTPAPGKLSAQTTGASSDCSCQPTPAAGYRGLENQLYRVEIHGAGTEATATFKWSRENGSVVVAVTGVAGADVAVDSLGPDANLGFQAGQWVELSDDTYLFGPNPNQPGELFQIKSVSPEHNTITMTAPVANIDPARNARLRRWEQFGASSTTNGVPLSVNSWIDLENGIQVRFAAGQFQSGDYWLIPARTATGQIEWPPCGGDGAQFQPPHRMDVIRAPLACIHWDATTQKFPVEDCRRLFPPLTDVAGGALSALHVAKISWSNDDVLPFDQLLATGLTVTLDQAPTSRIDSSIFALTLEVPVVSRIETAAVEAGLSPIALRTSMPIDGQITVNEADINWNIPFRGSKGEIPQIQLEALLLLDLTLIQGLSYATFVRARIKMYGRDIFTGAGTATLFLDGQCFGAPGIRADGATPRTDLMFPSGADEIASDFDSWFFLAPTLTLVGLSVQPAAVIFTPTAPNLPDPVATLTVNYAALADTVVTLSVIPPANITAAATVPATVTIPKGKTSVSFSVGVRNTSIATAQVFQIVASLTNALGLTGTVSASLSITGFQIIL